MIKFKKPKTAPLATQNTRNSLSAVARLKSSAPGSAPAPDAITQMVAEPLTWLQQYTRTKDSHWQEAGARSPHRPFPDKPYFAPLVSSFQQAELSKLAADLNSRC